MTILNVAKLQVKLSRLEKNAISDENLRKAVLRGLSPVQANAKLLVPSNSGELRNKIYKQSKIVEDGVRGSVYTNVKYGPYVELGTGPRGAADHDDISPNIHPKYTLSPWWIHEGTGENEVDRETAEKYHWFFIDTPEGRFYKVTGQPAQPFMYPALKSQGKNATEEIGKYIAKKIREEVKK